MQVHLTHDHERTRSLDRSVPIRTYHLWRKRKRILELGTVPFGYEVKFGFTRECDGEIIGDWILGGF